MNSPIRNRNHDADEKFELVDHLGQGGFAHTYRARVTDPELIAEFGAEEVALKIPLAGKERALKHELEVNAALHLRMKNLRSLNLVRYLGFEVFRGQIVMVMEYIRQGSLRKKLGKVGQQKVQSVDEAVEITQGILGGLAIIHQEHVFHRDIKPENILMEAGTPKIADLGIARMLQTNELASTTTGTLYYMSPEILGEEGADFRSDIWSVGVTLYEMVTGKLPFGGENTPIGIMTDLIRRSEPVPACEVSKNVPRKLSEIISRSLKKEKKDRFGNAEEMIEQLGKLKEGPDEKISQEIAAVQALTSASPREKEAKLQDLVRKYPNSPAVYQELGLFYNGCLRYAEAIATFKRGLGFNQRDAMLHWNLANAYQGLGQKSDAAQNFQKAVELGLDPSFERYAKARLKLLKS
jgi:serine/threonine-protein kinase